MAHLVQAAHLLVVTSAQKLINCQIAKVVTQALFGMRIIVHRAQQLVNINALKRIDFQIVKVAW